MSKEFESSEFEAFLRNTLAKATASVGHVVADFLASPFLPTEAWQHRQRQSTTAIMNGGWADIKVIELYEFERHHTTFVCTGSNVMPSLSERYADKPVVWFISRNNETREAVDCGQYYLVQVCDDLTRDQWKKILCRFVMSHADRLQGLPQHVVEWFHREDVT